MTRKVLTCIALICGPLPVLMLPGDLGAAGIAGIVVGIGISLVVWP